MCKRSRKPHKFQLLSEKVKEDTCTTVHENSKVRLFALNYQLADVIQSMGCGPSNATKLVGLLDFLISNKIEWHLILVEVVLGPIQKKLQSAIKIDAVQDKVGVMQENNDLNYHKCTIEGNDHPLLPKLKRS